MVEHRVPEESYARMPIEGINEPTENAKAVRVSSACILVQFCGK